MNPVTCMPGQMRWVIIDDWAGFFLSILYNSTILLFSYCVYRIVYRVFKEDKLKMTLLYSIKNGVWGIVGNVDA